MVTPLLLTSTMATVLDLAEAMDHSEDFTAEAAETTLEETSAAAIIAAD